MFHSIASAAPFCGRGKTQVADWSHQLPLLIIGRCQSRLLKLLDISILMFFLTMLLIYVLTRSCQCFFRSPHTLNRLEVSFLVVNTNEHREHHHKLEMKSVLLCNAMKKKKKTVFLWVGLYTEFMRIIQHVMITDFTWQPLLHCRPGRSLFCTHSFAYFNKICSVIFWSIFHQNYLKRTSRLRGGLSIPIQPSYELFLSKLCSK